MYTDTWLEQLIEGETFLKPYYLHLCILVYIFRSTLIIEL